MVQYPKVSVITVCLNVAAALEKTLGNVAAQNYDALEVIVVDGNSTDGTKDVLASHDRLITKSVSEPDKGIYDAMNKGVSMAEGEYCIFMNAGDMFAAPDVLRRIFNEKRRADVIYGDVVKGGRIKKAEQPHNSHRMFFCHQSSLVRTECLRCCPFDIKYTMSADFKFFKQMWKQGASFQYADFAISIFDTEGVSNTSRAKGIWQNVNIIRETDGLADRLRLLPRLYFVLFMLKVRGFS